jgi:hypothetical protein
VPEDRRRALRSGSRMCGAACGSSRPRRGSSRGSAALYAVSIFGTSPFEDFRLSRGVTWLEPTLHVELTYSKVMEGRRRRWKEFPVSNDALNLPAKESTNECSAVRCSYEDLSSYRGRCNNDRYRLGCAVIELRPTVEHDANVSARLYLCRHRRGSADAGQYRVLAHSK